MVGNRVCQQLFRKVGMNLQAYKTPQEMGFQKYFQNMNSFEKSCLGVEEGDEKFEAQYRSNFVKFEKSPPLVN